MARDSNSGHQLLLPPLTAVLHLRLGPRTGLAETDVCGVCAGSSECVDCLGVAFGPNRLDLCGVCDADPTNDCQGALPLTPETPDQHNSRDDQREKRVVGDMPLLLYCMYHGCFA